MAAGKQAGGDPTPWIVLAIVLGSFAGSVGHLYDVAAGHGAGWMVGGVSLMAVLIAALPEVQVFLCVLRVMRGGLLNRPAEAVGVGLVGLSAIAFTVAANLATIPAGAWGDSVSRWPGWAAVVAVWPAWSSIGGAGLMDPAALRRGHSPQRAPARAMKPAAPARGAAKEPRPGHPPIPDPPRGRQGAASPVAAGRAEAPLLPARATRQTAVLTAVSDAGTPLSRAEVAARTGLERDAVKPVLRALVEAGHLTRVGEGPRTAYAQAGA